MKLIHNMITIGKIFQLEVEVDIEQVSGEVEDFGRGAGAQFLLERVKPLNTA